MVWQAWERDPVRAKVWGGAHSGIQGQTAGQRSGAKLLRVQRTHVPSGFGIIYEWSYSRLV